jgi:hypothetical protein
MSAGRRRFVSVPGSNTNDAASRRCIPSVRHAHERWARQARETARVRYMVIETYTNGPEAVYRRAAERGRMLPPGLVYVDSWVVDDNALDRCFQLMESDDAALFDTWTAAWADLATVEIHPVIDSTEVAAHVAVGWEDTR